MIATRGLDHVTVPPMPYVDVLPGPAPGYRDVWLPWWSPAQRAANPTHHNTTASSSTVVGNTCTVNKPTLSDGDWMIAHIQVRAAQVVTPPAGWSPLLVSLGGGNASSQGVWVKYVPVAASEGAANYSWTWGGVGVKFAGQITSVSGAAPTNIGDAFVAIVGEVNVGSATFVVPRLFTRPTSGLSMFWHASDGGNCSITVGSGYTQSATFQTGTSSGPDTRVTAAYKALTNVVPVSTSHTENTSRANHVIHLLVRTATTPMPYALRSYTSSGNNATSSHGLVLPVLWSPGDLGVMVVGNQKAGIASVSSVTSGWSQIGATIGKCNLGSTACVAEALFVRTLQAGDTAMTTTWNASGSCAALSVIVSLGDPGAVALATLADTTDNSTFDIPALTVEAAPLEYWNFASVMVNRDTGPTQPSGFSRYTGPVRPGNSTTTLDWRAITAANPAATNCSAGNTGASTALHFVIRPAATRQSKVYMIS